MSALTMTITTAGRAALVNRAAGGTTAVVIAQAGVTASVVTVAPTLTALPGEIKRISSIAGQSIDATTVHLVARDDSTDAYTVRAIALYLADGTLFAVYGQADPIFQKADVSTFYLAADFTFPAADAALIQFGNTNFLNPPSSETVQGVSYLATVAEALAGAVANKTITPATMASVLANYVRTAQLAVANGVATLGSDGKLLLAQRPPIDLIDVWPAANQAAMLALTATVGDFAVRTDNGLVYVLQSTPATTLANWLVLSTPAPVSSVNTKVGTVVLVPADIGAVPTGRLVSTNGLATGGGSLAADRTISVPIASQAQASAGTDNTLALTPLSIAPLIAQVGGGVPAGRTIGGTGLATGGGSLAANRTLDVAIASVAEIVAGLENGKAITPLGLAGLPQSLTPNGYYMWPGGWMMQWVQYRGVVTTEMAIYVSFPIAFTTIALPQAATAFISAASNFRDMWVQVAPPGLSGANVQLQSATSDNRRVDGFDLIIFGK